VDTVTNKIYASPNSRLTTTVIDGPTNTVIATLGYVPGWAINPSTDLAYVVGVAPSTMSILDLGTNVVIATIPLVSPDPFSALNPEYAVVDSVANRLYVLSYTPYYGSTISVFDGATDLPITSIQL
jgi:DNA-binding beta-propeller fold protein YncE